jgi:hypothetical protein
MVMFQFAKCGITMQNYHPFYEYLIIAPFLLVEFLSLLEVPGYPTHEGRPGWKLARNTKATSRHQGQLSHFPPEPVRAKETRSKKPVKQKTNDFKTLNHLMG